MGVDCEPRDASGRASSLARDPARSRDMRTFRLKKQFDVVSCLFSAIGHLKTKADVQANVRQFRSSLEARWSRHCGALDRARFVPSGVYSPPNAPEPGGDYRTGGIVLTSGESLANPLSLSYRGAGPRHSLLRRDRCWLAAVPRRAAPVDEQRGLPTPIPLPWIYSRARTAGRGQDGSPIGPCCPTPFRPGARCKSPCTQESLAGSSRPVIQRGDIGRHL